jgi:curved DNA-binding protein CbpA
MTEQMLDPYAVLGIPRNASAQRAREAYRRLAKRYHPDLHPDAETTERMRRINRAWEIVSSPDRRARYDADHARAGSSSTGHWAGSTRWTAPPAPQHAAASAQWASASQARSAARAAWPDGTWGARRRVDRPVPEEWDEGPSWFGGVLAVLAVLVVIAATIVGLLPAPLFAVVLLLAGRWIVSRFD